MTIEQIREVLNSTDMPGLVAQNIVDSIVEIRSAAYNEGWNDRDNVGTAAVVNPPAEEEDNFSNPAFVVGAVLAQLEDLTHREKLSAIGYVLQNLDIPWTDANAIDELVDFVRTPEWSVSMLEDIAEIVRKARPDIGEEFDADDDRAWRSH